MTEHLIVIGGPTATGKSALAVALAKKINGEIVSADSMQVYKLMNIGTAKPTLEEKQGVRHFLIDEIYPDVDFCVADFQDLAKRYIADIRSRGKQPILVGGTGFYINSVVYNHEFTEAEKDEAYRSELLSLSQEKGTAYLHALLEKLDPAAATEIHPNNVKRVIRALEYFKLTNTKISEANASQRASKVQDDSIHFFILNTNRATLYDRINRRVDQMVKDGLFDEVKNLLELGYTKELTSMMGIGYKEIIPYFENQLSKEEAIESIKTNSRHYAKRQLTWFKHQCEGLWLDLGVLEVDRVLEQMICRIG